jgi:hypothetical protein
LADAGYWKNDAIDALVAQGIQTLVAPDADRRKEPGPAARRPLRLRPRVWRPTQAKTCTSNAKASSSRCSDK